MTLFNIFNLFSGGLTTTGSEQSDLIIGSFGSDTLDGNGGNDLVFGLSGDDKISGGLGDDTLFGGRGHDHIVGNKGDDRMVGGAGNDLLEWNNGDGSDLMLGGDGDDRVQVNFNTDLVNTDLQNKDVAEFSLTPAGVQFARVELNDQTAAGLFQLDIRDTETLETNFGGGDDTAVIKGDLLGEIDLDLDGGAGIDTLDLSQVADAVIVNLKTGKLNASSATGFENVIGTAYDDKILGDKNSNEISGLDGADQILGRAGNDTLVGNKGDDFVFGGRGNDTLVWNNGDGSDLLDGGKGNDLVQVNFDTDLVNENLENKDVAEFSVTDAGVQFARIELNGQTKAGLFQLDIRDTETLETNFGAGDDAAVLVGKVLDEVILDLDGGEGVDLLDLSQVATAVDVNLATGAVSATDPVYVTASETVAGPSSAVNFEDVTGTAFDDVITGNDGDNVIRGGAGNDTLVGGDGADTFVFFEEDAGIDVINDFVFGQDSLLFRTSDPEVTTASLLGNLSQVGDDVELAFNNKVITFEDTVVTDFHADDFMIA